MALWDPMIILRRCDETKEFVESRNYNNCAIINFIYVKFPKVFDEYLLLPLAAVYRGLQFGIVLKYILYIPKMVLTYLARIFEIYHLAWYR